MHFNSLQRRWCVLALLYLSCYSSRYCHRRTRLNVCVCVCVFIKLHITAHSDPIFLVILCYSHWFLQVLRIVYDGFVSLVTTGWGGSPTVLGSLDTHYVGHSRKRVKSGWALETCSRILQNTSWSPVVRPTCPSLTKYCLTRPVMLMAPDPRPTLEQSSASFFQFYPATVLRWRKPFEHIIPRIHYLV
jgi:hypothetical protein